MRAGLILGMMMIASGVFVLVGGDFPWRGTLVLSKMGWLKIILGLVICTVSIWDAERRAKAKLREDAAKKAAKDAVKPTLPPDAASIQSQASDSPKQEPPSKDYPHTHNPG